MTQYGILDDFGAVVRWIDYKPAHGRYITRKVVKPSVFELYEPAPF